MLRRILISFLVMGIVGSCGDLSRREKSKSNNTAALQLVQPGQFILIGAGTAAASAALIAALPIVIMVGIPLGAGYALYQVLEPGYVPAGGKVFSNAKQAQTASGYIAATKVIADTVTSDVTVTIKPVKPTKNGCMAASFRGNGPLLIKKSMRSASYSGLCAYVCEQAAKDVCSPGLMYEVYGACALKAGLAGPRRSC